MHRIKKASDIHINDIAHLAYLLWPNTDEATLHKEVRQFQSDSTAELFICEEDNQIVGFAHVQLRYDYVEGTETVPVGYLEGLYVKEDYRNRGIGELLVHVSEDWARFMNATEFASDVEIDNEISANFHKKVGFKEVNRVIHYSKKL